MVSESTNVQWIRTVSRWISKSDKIAAVMKPIARYIEETRISVRQLATAARLDTTLVKAIVSSNYTPSPVAWPPPWAFLRTTFPGGTRSRSNTYAVTVHNADAQLD
jgi:hypothetical protein